MVSIGALTISPVVALVGVIIVALLAVGVFRFLLRMAWRVVGLVLTAVVFCGIVVVLMNAIKVH